MLQSLQSLSKHLVNSFSKASHISVCVLHVDSVDFVHLLDGALEVVIVAIEFVVEGSDNLLLLLEFLIDRPQFGLHHSPKHLRYFLSTIILLLS